MAKPLRATMALHRRIPADARPCVLSMIKQYPLKQPEQVVFLLAHVHA